MVSRKGWRGRLNTCLVLFLGQVFGTGAWAGSFAVDPIRLNLSAAAPVAALTVRNTGDSPTLVQLELVAWAMANSEERYTPTDDILATPPIFTVRPGQTQIVRVGLRRPPAGPRERPYRLFLQEPPVQRQGDRTQGLHVTLRIGIPVFVAPTAPARPDVVWRASRVDEDAVRIEAANAGNAHTKLTDISLSSDEQEWPMQEGFAYLLPGDTRYWIVHTAGAAPDETLTLRAGTEGGAVEVELEM